MLAPNHLAGTHSHQDSRPGATRLEVGPRESRAGSRVPRYTSQPCRASHVSGRGCTRPGGSSRRGAPSHVPVEAPCSALADDTAEERLCPYTYGSAMLRAGDKQLRAASRPYQPQGAPELSVQPHRNASPRESRARGLGTGAALGSRPSICHPTRSPRPGGCARVTPKRTPPNQVSRTWSSHAPPEASARAGMETVCASRGTPEHRDSGA